MRLPPRAATFFVLATYFLLSAVPFVPLLFGRTVAAPAQILAIELAMWLVAWAIFVRPAWFHWMLLPAFAALPIELYLQYFYGQDISVHHLGIIMETSPREALEFLGSKIWLLVLVVVLIVTWWGACWIAACRTRSLDWRGKSRWLALAILAIAGGLGLYESHVGLPPPLVSASNAIASKDEDDSSEDASIRPATFHPTPAGRTVTSWPNLPHWAHIPLSAENFGRSWPFGLSVTAYQFWQERTYLGRLTHTSALFHFGAHQTALTNTPQIVVMVIGESSRYDRWSLNGYSRQTNPLLEKETNLISLTNMVTAVSATRLSVPILMSRKPATQSLKAGFAEKSFLSAYKEAGFKTYWLSNQMSFGQFDTPISVFANEADVTQFLNLGGFTDNSSFDEVLLAPLKIAMADPAPKKLIVLHTLGNHWNYSHRHPKQFDRWQPSLFGISNPVYTDIAIKERLNNSYDNSILYTDWFLAQVIDALKASPALTSLMYVSDHGQTLYDGTCNLAFHGHNTQFEFHVPALVWYSDAYQHTFPDKVAQLKRNKRAKLATENIFHSLLDMADIHYDSERLEWSFLSRKLQPHNRYVDSYGWTDYDNANFKGDCREVIDKGKPLVQEK